jgi:hypothetical protein
MLIRSIKYRLIIKQILTSKLIRETNVLNLISP